MSDQQPTRLTSEDLYSASVDGYLEQQDSLRAAPTDLPVQPLVVRVIYSSWFYLMMASAIGAFIAWATIEPFFSDQDISRGGSIAALLLFPVTAAGIGLFLGAVEGLMCRQIGRAALCASVGLGIGFIGGLVAIFAGGIVFSLMSALTIRINGGIEPGQMPHGFALLVFMMGRGAAWAIAALPAGIGQGIALRERKIVLNGLIGAMLGGLIGGLLFDPIYLMLASPQEASASRAVGLTVIGAMVGLFVGLVEQWTKSAWLMMEAGPLAGKQFVLYRNPTVVGSSPKADIYLFKDEAIEPRHCLIHNRGGRFELEDCDTPDGTYINGIPIQRQFLQNGDKIVIGKTVFEFSLRESK